MSSYSRLLQIFTFTRRPWLHFFLAKKKEKLRIISKSLVSLQFIFKPKSHIFHFTYKYFHKSISHIMPSAKAVYQHSWVYTFWVIFLLIGTFLSPQIRSGGYKNSQRKLRHHSTRLENFHDDHLSS